MKKLMSLILGTSLVVGAATLWLVVAFAYPIDTQETSTNNPKIAKPNTVNKNAPVNGTASGDGKLDRNVVGIGNNKVNKTDPSSPPNKHDWGDGNAPLNPYHKVDVGVPASGNATGKRNPGNGSTTVNRNAGKKPPNPQNAKTINTVNKEPKLNKNAKVFKADASSPLSKNAPVNKGNAKTTNTANKAKGRK